MDGARVRIIGLVGILVGFAVDHGFTVVVTEHLPTLAPPALLDAYGRYVFTGVGFLGTFLGGFVAGAIARRHRIEFALGEGLVSAAMGVPQLLVALEMAGIGRHAFEIATLLFLTVLVAVAGGGIAHLVLGLAGERRGPDAHASHAAVPVLPSDGGAAVPSGTFRAAFHGDGADLFRIHIVNMFLIFLTLGMYRFWGRVKVRRYLYSHTEFEGDRFAFHGTGWEAFRGWLKGAAFVGLPIIGIRFLEQFVSIGFQALLEMVVLGVVGLVVPIAICGAWRYRLTRTEWRGLRFSFRGPAAEALRVWVGSLLLTVLSLGVCFPLLQVNLHRFLTRHAYYGTRRFDFDGRGADLVRGWVVRALLPGVPTVLLALLLFVPTFGLSLVFGGLLAMRIWYGYTAYKTRYLMAHTQFDSARFRSTMTGLGLFGVALLNICLVWGTFGLGIPWAQVNRQKYALANLALEGPLDLAGVVQDAQQASVTGEGIADVLDSDAIDLGIGV